jgi:hypothetical protein
VGVAPRAFAAEDTLVAERFAIGHEDDPRAIMFARRTIGVGCGDRGSDEGDYGSGDERTTFDRGHHSRFGRTGGRACASKRERP